MKKLLAALGITGSMLMVGGLAVASIPGPTGVINGCRSNSTGLIYVKDSSESCGFNMTALPWNQTGPQGPAGAAGAQGPAGPAGPSGISGLHIVLATGSQVGGTPVQEYSASCPSSEQLIGFSGNEEKWFPGPTVTTNNPIAFTNHDLTSAKWKSGNAGAPSSTSVAYEVQLTCAA